MTLLVVQVTALLCVGDKPLNGGVDPQTREFSPGSVLSYLNTQAAWPPFGAAARLVG